jgi:hypothetical protein
LVVKVAMGAVAPRMDYDAYAGRWTAKDLISSAETDTNLYTLPRSSPAYFLIAEASFLLSSMQKSNSTGLAARG